MKNILSKVLTLLFDRKYYYVTFRISENEYSYYTGDCTIATNRLYRKSLTGIKDFIISNSDIKDRRRVAILFIERVSKNDFKTVCKKEGNNESMDKQQS